MDNESLAAAFKALGDPTRLRIYQAIKDKDDICACNILDGHHPAHPFPPCEATLRRRAGQLSKGWPLDALLRQQRDRSASFRLDLRLGRDPT